VTIGRLPNPLVPAGDSESDHEHKENPIARTWITVPMEDDLKDRITKAAGKTEISTARLMRRAAIEYLKNHDLYSIPGPRKGRVTQ